MINAAEAADNYEELGTCYVHYIHRHCDVFILITTRACVTDNEIRVRVVIFLITGAFSQFYTCLILPNICCSTTTLNSDVLEDGPQGREGERAGHTAHLRAGQDQQGASCSSFVFLLVDSSLPILFDYSFPVFLLFSSSSSLSNLFSSIFPPLFPRIFPISPTAPPTLLLPYCSPTATPTPLLPPHNYNTATPLLPSCSHSLTRPLHPPYSTLPAAVRARGAHQRP